MIVDTAETRCTIKVLSLLSRSKSKYNDMFRETKVSHTTLQSVLKELETKKFIRRNEIGIVNTEYEITEKGMKLLSHLNTLKDLL